MTDHGIIFASGRCWSCRAFFTFDPDLVPSLPIDPKTNAPLDVDPAPDGLEAARARAVKQPLCERCVAAANAARAERGAELIHVLPGAYPFDD